jgi:predicted tellurium resistance membrane protein TerC
MAKHHLDRCVDVPSSTWCNVCIHIMDELSLVIDCLCFFFLFSLLTTKVHNYPLFVYCLLLFVYCLLGFDMTARHKRHKVVDCNSKTYLGMVCN